MDQNVHGNGVVNRVRLSQVVSFVILMLVLLIGLGLCSDSEDYGIYSMADLNRDGMTEEYLLIDHCLTIREGKQELWRSPSDWSIDSFALGDINNDGTVNVVLALWKTGSFGASKPFWQTGEDVSYKNHLFIYQLKDNVMKQVWCSSDLDRPIVSFTIQDTDHDDLLELVVEEGQYRKIAGEHHTLDTFTRNRTTIWKWDEWGFRLAHVT